MKLRILLVDDEDKVRSACNRALSQKNFIIDEAINGMDALEKVAKNKPDIIILDGRMPVMDGIEASKHLKANPSTKDIPILFSTGTHIQEVLDGTAKVDDYIVKPYGIDELYQKILKLLGQ